MRLWELGRGRIQDHDTVCLGWLRHRLTGLPEQCDVLGHRLDHQLLSLAVRGSGGDNPGQVRGVRRIAGLSDPAKLEQMLTG